MASARIESSPVCPICFESHEVLKILDSCQHSFCLPCLSRHSARHKSQTIPCPTCQVECAVPSGGLEMFEDFTGEEISDDVGAAMKKCEQKSQVTDQIDKTRDLDKLVDVKCQICHHQNIVIQADNICPECDQLHLCKNCTALHATSKATRHHIVVPLKAQAKGSAVCVKHNAHMTMHCTTCNKPACKICVMLDHRDHDVESLSDMIVTKIDRVKATIKEREDEVKKLRCLTKQLAGLMPVATQLDQRDVMLKDIEDHAQKWVDHIVTWKEDMKAQVDKKFQITSDIPKSFEVASKVIKQLEKALSKAGALLANTELVPSYLEKLTTMQSALDKVPNMSIETDEQKYSERLSELQQSYPKFQPEAPRLPIGKLDFQVASGEVTKLFKVASGDQSELKVQPEALPLLKGKRANQASAGEVTEIFSHTLKKPLAGEITCVTISGDKCAIAYFRSLADGSVRHIIHIYEINGKYCRTLKECHVNHGIIEHDMISTIHGKFAVWIRGANGIGNRNRVEVIDPDNGQLISKLNLSILNVISFCVGLQNQFVFLSSLGLDFDHEEITIVNEDGSTQLKQEVDNIEDWRPCHISCSLRFIFVTSGRKIHVFEMKDAGLVETSTISVNTPNLRDIIGISATPRDHFIIVNDDSKGKYSVHKYCQKEGEEKWATHDKKQILSGEYTNKCRTCTRWSHKHTPASISTNGDHMVFASGDTFKVYKY